MTTLPIPNALNQAALKLGLHVLLTREGEAITAVLVYQAQGDKRAIITWERGHGIVRRRGLTWVPCSLGEAESTMIEAQVLAKPLDPNKPEPCECDQVQRLRQERDDACSALNRAVEHAMTAEGIIARCLRKMPVDMEHGGCLETAVDLLRKGMLMPLGRGAELAAECDDALARITHDAGKAAAHVDGAVLDPLDDPRMDGEAWIPAQDVTQEMLDAWPVWQWKRWESTEFGDIGFVPTWPVGETADGMGGLRLRVPMRGFGDGLLRPLRLPGMNAAGEIPASGMTPEHFERVHEWQWCNREEYNGQWCATIWQPSMDDVDQRAESEVWRPTIFAKLDER